jgi:flagellar biosynthesis protein FlhG
MIAIRPGPARTRRSRVLAVASGKGGVGKTFLAITLTHALVRRGMSVLLFDADLGLANVDIQLGLMPAHDVGAVIEGRITMADAVVHHPGGFDILAGRSGSGSLATLGAAALEGILAGLHDMARRYDVVVMDLGAGLDQHVRRMAAFADLLTVVATDEPTSLTDAYAVLKLHAADQGQGESVIIINQAATPTAGERTYTTLARACAAFLGRAPRLAGIIRRDDKVRDAIRRQTLLLDRHPNTAAAADIERLAGALLAAPSPAIPAAT